MKIYNTALIVALSATLVACGSSSSQGTAAPTSTPTSIPTPTKKPVATPDTGIKVTGNTSSGRVQSHVGYTPNTDLNKFTINGQTIALVPPGVSAPGLYRATMGINGDNISRVIGGSRFKHSRFGLLYPRSGTELTVFSQGIATKDMPNTGAANYVGQYVGYDYTNNRDTYGAFTAAVNFGTKTVRATFDADNRGTTPDTFHNIPITGNTFNAHGVDGKFYGPQATEMGGVYSGTRSGKNYTAAFGAVKQ